MGLFSAFFGRPRLTAVESRVISAVSGKLPPAAKQLFDAQMDRVNRIQRFSSGKEANFYTLKRGKPSLEERFLFPLRTETLLATVHLNLDQDKKPLRADVWLVNGHVFSVDFNKIPGNPSEEEIHVAKVEILRDAMIAASAGSAFETKRREEVLATIRSKLPDEYLQLVGEGQGVTVNDWAVSGIQGIRKVVQRDANYYLLAEKEGMGAIGIKEDESSGQIYYLDYGDDQGEQITVGLRKFLEEFEGGKAGGRF
ncbi:MAG TPA: hypothetical protein VN673_08620 [Clostridia bacterium]|nr:hypothetical protein [Clostridia bacterium]